MKTVLVLLLCLVHMSYGRDYYFGMFQENDFLVAADELYKPRTPSRITWANYGRVFKCPITYFRIVDRLGVGSNSNPRVEIIRGGIQKKYIVVRLSVYNQPISVNIYAGCHNKNKNFTRPRVTTKCTKNAVTDASTKDGETVPDTNTGADDAKDNPEDKTEATQDKDEKGNEDKKEDGNDDKGNEEKENEEEKKEEEEKPEE